MGVLVAYKNEEDPIKNEKKSISNARVPTEIQKQNSMIFP